MGSSCCTLDDSDAEDRQALATAEGHVDTHSQNPSSNVTLRPHGAQREVRQNFAVRRRHATLFRPTGNSQQPVGTGADQIRIAQRQRIIEQIPSVLYEDCMKKFCNECPICIIDFEGDHEVKSLPCLHLFHKKCIDDWLMRHLRCPSCNEPVDAALVSQFDNFGSL